ncbi:MAG: polysaccharide deacetylase family protein [Bacteroidota bacterium]|nr:polysaccharide deacetylase family protein [Bacteroidota bacterium]
MTVCIQKNNTQERQYILSVLLDEFLGLTYTVEFSSKPEYKFVLGNKKELIFKDRFFSFHPENGSYLKKENLPNRVTLAKNDYTAEEDIPILFGESGCWHTENGIVCEIDIFAGSFFMLSRWEEYVCSEKDKHNRFPENKHVVIQNRIEQRPIVNEYVVMLKNMLKALGCKQQFKSRNYSPVITHDIDFSQRFNTPLHFFKALVWSIIIKPGISAPFKIFKDYTAVLKGKPDPYNRYDFFMNISEKYRLKSLFYFIPAYKGEEGATYDIRDTEIVKAIKQILRRGHSVGVHGSYGGYNCPERFKSEQSRLAEIAGSVKEGRQHFLRFSVPKSIRLWENAGLKYDSSFGFSRHMGFRAGVCFPYSLFDIKERRKSQVQERPLIAMDAAMGRDKSSEKIIQNVKVLAKTVAKYKGDFVLLWHNNSFYDPHRRELSLKYPELIEMLINK